MTLRDFQDLVAAALNADVDLSQAGCMTFAEDRLGTADTDIALQKCAGVVLVVGTPSCRRAGAGTGAAGIQIEIEQASVIAIETPATNRERPGHMTALQAAQRAAIVLDEANFCFQSLQQNVDEEAGTLTAEATFRCSITLTYPAQSPETQTEEA